MKLKNSCEIAPIALDKVSMAPCAEDAMCQGHLCQRHPPRVVFWKTRGNPAQRSAVNNQSDNVASQGVKDTMCQCHPPTVIFGKSGKPRSAVSSQQTKRQGRQPTVKVSGTPANNQQSTIKSDKVASQQQTANSQNNNI